MEAQLYPQTTALLAAAAEPSCEPSSMACLKHTLFSVELRQPSTRGQ